MALLSKHHYLLFSVHTFSYKGKYTYQRQKFVTAKMKMLQMPKTCNYIVK